MLGQLNKKTSGVGDLNSANHHIFGHIPAPKFGFQSSTWQRRSPPGRRSYQTRCSTSRWRRLPGSRAARPEGGCPWPWSLTDRWTRPSETPAWKETNEGGVQTEPPLLLGFIRKHLQNVILSGQVEHLSSDVEGNDGKRWNLLTVDEILQEMWWNHEYQTKSHEQRSCFSPLNVRIEPTKFS